MVTNKSYGHWARAKSPWVKEVFAPLPQVKQPQHKLGLFGSVPTFELAQTQGGSCWSAWARMEVRIWCHHFYSLPVWSSHSSASFCPIPSTLHLPHSKNTHCGQVPEEHWPTGHTSLRPSSGPLLLLLWTCLAAHLWHPVPKLEVSTDGKPTSYWSLWIGKVHVHPSQCLQITQNIINYLFPLHTHSTFSTLSFHSRFFFNSIAEEARRPPKVANIHDYFSFRKSLQV